jgi:hypothetical protein
MRKAFTLAAAVSLLSFSSAAKAHVPEGLVLGVWQWPTTHLPVMDGDISEWDVVPDNLWLSAFSEFNGEPLNTVVAGEVGAEVNAADLNFRWTQGWNDELDRLYFTYDRFDDLWDRDAGGVGGAGGDDSFEINIDANHGGDVSWFGANDFDTEEEVARNRGRLNQMSHYRWPPMEPIGWNWLWASSATWHDTEPYSCCGDSFTLNGAHGTEATMQAEWWTIAWDDFDHESPDNSIQHDFVENEIIGLSISVIDNDVGTDNETDKAFAAWRLGGQRCGNGDGKCATDFILLPAQLDLLPTAVEDDSWGHIKASYMR